MEVDIQQMMEELIQDMGSTLGKQARLYAGDLVIVVSTLRDRLVAQGNDPAEVFALAKREAESLAAQRLARLVVEQRQIIVGRVWASLDLALNILTALADNQDGGTDDGTRNA